MATVNLGVIKMTCNWLALAPTNLGLGRQPGQDAHQRLRHLLRTPLEEPAAAAQEESVAREDQLVLSLK